MIMNKIFYFVVALLICSATSFSQTYPVTQTIGAPATMVISRGGFKADSALVIPSFIDTFKANVSPYIKSYAGNIIRIGDSLYMRSASAGKWIAVNSASGGSVDTTSLSNRINARVKYTDTAAMLAPYLRKADTTAMLTPYLRKVDTLSLSSRINGRIDSIRRSNDSIYARKNGVFVFQYKDSIGGESAAANDTAKVVIAKVHNATGTLLQRGEVVYLSGAIGNVAAVKRANNKQDSTSSRTFGIVRSNIAAGDTGYIVTQGQIDKLNLGSPYQEGDILWLDSIDGQFTRSVPIAPYHSVFLGVVERANNGNGILYVKVQNGYELGELHNVRLNGVVNNQVLAYSDTQKIWKNRNIYTIVDTTHLSLRIDQRVKYTDTAAMLANFMHYTDTASLSTRINQRLLISDTSVFQHKQLPAYSFQANGTNAAANGTATYFKDTSGTYTGTIAWSNSAPTGTTNHTYRWTRIGKMVTLEISLVYGTVSAANNTNVVVALPSDAPTPSEPAGLTVASAYMYPAYCNGGNVVTTSNTQTYRGGLRNNAANNGYEIIMSFNAATFIYYTVAVTYWTD